MRRPRQLVVIVSALLAAGAACTSFGGDPNEEPPSPQPEASTGSDSSNDASVTDALADASLPDGSAPDAARRCADASAHWICDDFDREGGQASGPQWAVPTIVAPGELSLLGLASAPSPPNVLVATAPEGGAAQLEQARFATSQGARCEFDVLVTARGTVQANLAVLSVEAAGGGYYRLEVRASSNGSTTVLNYGSVADGGPISTSEISLPLSNAQWSHVAIELGFGAKARLSVMLDGFERAPSTPAYLAAFGSSSTQRITLGTAVFGGATPPWSAQYDNVVCDALP